MEEKGINLDEFLNTEDIARVLKKNVATIQRWCREGELPAAKLGRTYMVRKQDFETWYSKKVMKCHLNDRNND
jgi:excisionase family DNA binding protein